MQKNEGTLTVREFIQKGDAFVIIPNKEWKISRWIDKEFHEVNWYEFVVFAKARGAIKVKTDADRKAEFDFSLKHVEGKLFACVAVKGKNYEKDVTDYFERKIENAFDDWLDFRLGLTAWNTIKKESVE